MIAALFVQAGGVYFGLPDVDPWDQTRDARLYAGPWPVVAHPPCARWSTLAYVNRARYGIQIGDDDGCFASALASVRAWGGVLEHPRNSLAWPAFDLQVPVAGAWTRSLSGEWVTEVSQHHYGHRALKWTWLLACVPSPPPLNWTRPGRPSVWISSDRPRAQLKARGVEMMGKKERARTPLPFRDLLLSIARSASRVAA